MKNLYESAFFRKITRIADFFLVSLLFLITSLPVITCFTALTAMYYTMAKAVHYDAGTSTVRMFFHSFKENLKQGLFIGLLTIAAGVILYTFVDVANAVGWHTLYSRIYLVLTVVYSTVVIAVVLNLSAVVSRFRIKTLAAVKLSGQFAAAKPLRMLTYVLHFSAADPGTPGRFCLFLQLLRGASAACLDGSASGQERNSGMDVGG